MRSWMRGYMYTCKKYKDRRYFTLSGGEKAGKRQNGFTRLFHVNFKITQNMGCVDITAMWNQNEYKPYVALHLAQQGNMEVNGVSPTATRLDIQLYMGVVPTEVK